MATTLQELINGKDANTIKADLINLLADYGFDATEWESGDEGRTLLEIESKTLAELWTTVTEIAKGMYLDTATGGWLTLLAKSQYDLDRIPAEYTRGWATFSLKPGGGPRTISAGGYIIDDQNGHFFVTDNATPVTLTTGNPIGQVEIISQTTGAANNVAQGVLTHISQGTADVDVVNSGLFTPATVIGNNILGTYTVNGSTLKYQVTLDGVDQPLQTLTFAANYASTALLVAALNGNVTFASLLTATTLTPNSFSISTKAVGPSQRIRIDATGTSNSEFGFSTLSDTIRYGGTSIDSPPSISSAALAGPFNLVGSSLIISTTVDGVVLSPHTFLFTNNWTTMDQVAIDMNSAFAAFPQYSLVAANSNNRLVISTLRSGPKQSIRLLAGGTANIPLGFSSTSDTVAVGSSGWIIQEGRDLESDDSLRARCKARWGILGAGTRDAFITWAREADPKVQKVVVYSNYLNGTPKAGAVTVYIAGINSALDSITTANVYNYILAKMPIMSDLYVGSVTIVPVYYSGVLTISNIVNTPAFLNGYKNNITSYSQSLKIGEGVLKKRIEAEIISALRPGFIDLNLTEPTIGLTTVDRNELVVILEDPAAPMKVIVK